MANPVKTLLLVEDEVIIALNETILFKTEGYNVIHAITGEESIEIINNNSIKIDLIIMDINLGEGIDGTQAAEIILQTHDIPILFLSSHTENNVIEKIEKITSYGYIVKSSSDIVLLTSIKMAFRLYEAHQNIKQKKIEIENSNQTLIKTIIELQKTNDDLVSTKNSLRVSEERFRVAMDGTNDGVWEVKLPTGEVYLSPLGCEILGYSPDEINEKKTVWSELVHPDDVENINNILNAYLKGKEQLFHAEQRLKMKNGEWKWVLTRGKVVEKDNKGIPLRMVGTHTDISERKKIQKDLKTSENIFNLFMEYNPIYVFFKDENVRTIKLSKNYEKMLGKPMSELIGKNMYELFPSELAKNMVNDDLKILKEKKLVEVIEELEDKIYKTIKFPIYQDDFPPMLAGYTMDITQQKKTEDELKKSVSDNKYLLQELQHRVKNTFNLISGLISLEIMQQKNNSIKEVFKNIQNRIQSIEKLYIILYESNNISDIYLNVYIKQICDYLISSYIFDDKKIKISIQLEEILFPIKKAISIGLIINELLTNSLKYAFKENSEGNIKITIKRENDLILLEISDDGIGLPEDFSPDNSNGLGLKLINILNKQLSSSFEIIRTEGTCYRFFIP